MVGAELFAECEPRVAGSGQDHRVGAERLGDRDSEQADRPRPGDDDAFAGNQPAEHIEPVHRGAGGNDEGRLLVAHIVRHMDQSVDVVDRILGEAAVGGEAVGAMALGEIAVIEARGVHALPAAGTPATPGVNLDGDPVADRIFVDCRAETDHRSHVFVADREVLVERQAAIDHCRQPMAHDFEIGGADRHRVDPDQHFGSTGLGHRLFDRHDLARAAKHPGLHPLRYRILVVQPGLIRHRSAFLLDLASQWRGFSATCRRREGAPPFGIARAAL